jgi:hypothetical protein
MAFEMLASSVAHPLSAIARLPVVVVESALVVADEWFSIVHRRLSCFPTLDAGWLVFELDVFAVGRDAVLSGF